MLESLSHLWAWLSAWDIVTSIGAILIFLTLFEKGFGIEFVGRRIFRLIWKVIKGIVMRVAGPEIEKAKELFAVPARIEEKIESIATQADERDRRRSEEYSILSGSLRQVEKEVALNGGGSIKDAVMRLVKHDVEKWNILTKLHGSHNRIMLRLNILDDADGRMDFELSPELACTKISPRFLRFFGYTERDLVGSDWEFCISERSLAEVRSKWKRAVEKHVEYRNEQYIADSDGKEYLCLVRGYPLYNEGNFEGFYGTVEVIDKSIEKQWNSLNQSMTV